MAETSGCMDVNMTPIVAIVAPGSMGSAVGARLTEHKVNGTHLARRPQRGERKPRARSRYDGGERPGTHAKPISFSSIVPPGDALALAQRLAPVLTAANKKPVYVECNAVRPQTVNHIEKVIAATGCAFVGAGIIGPPPKPGASNTKIYASGRTRREFATLNDYGLIVRVLAGPLDRRLGAEDVLCRHHQGLHRARRRDDAGRHARRLGRGAQGRTRRKPAGAARPG